MHGMYHSGMDCFDKVVLSPRGRQNSQILYQEYNDKALFVADSNQDVVNQSDWVFIGVLPDQAEDVLGELRFKASQTVVSMISTATHQDLARLCAPVKTENIIRVVPLPAVKHLNGTTLVFPPHEQVRKFFDYLGTSIPVEDTNVLHKLQSTTALMGDMYQRMHTVQTWLVNKGVPKQTACQCVVGIFHTVIADSRIACKASSDAFIQLVNEQTPGGMNEQVIREQKEAGSYKNLIASLDSIEQRFSGASKDGDETQTKKPRSL